MHNEKSNSHDQTPKEEQPRQPPHPGADPRQPDAFPEEGQPQQPPRPEDDTDKKRPKDTPPFPKPNLPPS